MHVLLPFAMLFGFLSMIVRHGQEFGVAMPVVLLLLSGWSYVAFLRIDIATRVIACAGTVAAGFAAIALFGTTSLTTYASLGPSMFGAPLALVVVWAGVVIGLAAIARRVTGHWVRGALVVATLALAWSLVVEPAMFNLGVIGYRASGVYYGIPFAELTFWAASTAVGATVLRFAVGRAEAGLPLGTVAGPLLVLAYATGICVASGIWIPAVLGLLLVQAGFLAMHYL